MDNFFKDFQGSVATLTHASAKTDSNLIVEYIAPPRHTVVDWHSVVISEQQVHWPKFHHTE